MKRSRTVTLFAMLMALVLALSACGNTGGGSGSTEALTEEAYMEAVTKLQDAFTDIQNQAGTLDTTDVEAATQLLESMKAPLEEFIAVVPPESFSAAHDKLKSGSQALIDFLDTTLSIVGETDTTKLQDASTKMMEQIQTATTDMTEGSQLLAEAQG